MKFIIRIRFTNSISATQQINDLDLPISISLDTNDVSKLINTKWLKQQIRNKPECRSNRLRLIYNGRVLNDNTDFKQEIFLPKVRQTKSVDGDQLDGATSQQSENDLVVYIHCVIGEELTREQLNEESQLDNAPQQVSTTPDVIGFDRLLQQGFSQDDINDLRRQFHHIYNINQTPANDQIHDLEEEESRQQTVRQLEERWIESTINGNENSTTTDSSRARNGETSTTRASATAGANFDPVNTGPNTNANPEPQPQPDIDDVNGNFDLLIGLLVGIFLGVLSVVFVVSDDTVFSKRQKMSILAGLFINFSFAIVRGQWV
jgi:hypothetical protein